LRWAFVTETIGQEECPMMLRWSIWLPGPKKTPWFKVLIHYFPPNVSDRDPHDHPRSFLTLILRGGYLNTEWVKFDPPLDLGNGESQEWVPEMEWVGAGAIRFRRADHTHIVETTESGAWTLVIMGPERRPWGFLRGNNWLPWKKYVDQFGGVVRCDTGELDEWQSGEYPPYEVKGTNPGS
jgi:hypothetical protein